MEELPFQLAMAHKVFTYITKPILFPCNCKDFLTIIYLDDFLVLIHSEHMGKRAQSFVLPTGLLWATFSRSEVCLTQHFSF